MKNTAITLSNANLSQPVETSVERFNRINYSSRYFKALIEQSEQYTDDEGTHHFYQLHNYRLSSLLNFIVEQTFIENSKVTYHLDESNIICFTIINVARSEVDKVIFIHDASAKNSIEYILKITINSQVLQLCNVNKRSYAVRKARLDIKTEVHLPTNVYLTPSTNRIRCYTESMEMFLTAVNHFSWVIDATPEFTWICSSQEHLDGILYKKVRITSDNVLELSLFLMEGEEYIPEYSFSVKLGMALKTQVNPIFKEVVATENDLLMQRLNKENRVSKISNILESIP